MPTTTKFQSSLILSSIAITLFMSSCFHEKKFIYFQNTKKVNSIILNDSLTNYIPILRTDDLLSIIVSSIDPDLAKPFNLMYTGSVGTSTNNSNSMANSNTNNTTPIQGYLIDANGMVDFPILGALKLAGLNRMEATSLIKDRLKLYLKDPIVNIRVLNYKVTVLGEVARPGVFTIQNERITIPEALGLAGDITLGGKRTNVMVIRDIDGKKVETRVDLTSREMFKSPAYYLSQNDLIYVEPTLSRLKSTTSARQNASIALTSVILVINILNYFRK
jgi:polysaccharide biosynthesis/export protein